MLFADLDDIRRGTAYHALKGRRMSSPLLDDLWKVWVTSSLMTFVCLVLVTCYREISSGASSNFDRMTLGVAIGGGGAVRDGCYHDHQHCDYGRRWPLLEDSVAREKSVSLGVRIWIDPPCQMFQIFPYRSQAVGWMDACLEASLLD